MTSARLYYYIKDERPKKIDVYPPEVFGTGDPELEKLLTSEAKVAEDIISTQRSHLVRVLAVARYIRNSVAVATPRMDTYTRETIWSYAEQISTIVTGHYRLAFEIWEEEMSNDND